MFRVVVLSIIIFIPIGSKAQTAVSHPVNLTPHRITLTKGRSAGSFALNLPKDFAISVAVEGLKRVRFMAKSPDGRIFVTDMFNLTDNKQGVVYILDQFDPSTRSFKKVTTYLKNLRNPNSVAFYTDPQGVHWLYLALTDRLVRYRFTKGETAPTSAPELLATFPDYGLSYKYGGWHLTRTIAIGSNGKIYISVGSSCNACEEKEEVRASVIEMDPDGKNQKHFARGLRNAVGLRWIEGQLVATNMGSDHLGDDRPADTMYALQGGTNYGWPYCYQSGPNRFPDPKFNARSSKLNCRNVPVAYAAFAAHSSPLGFEYFDASSSGELRDSFLVGLHGSTKENLNRGYRVVRLRGRHARSVTPENFIDGFLEGKKIHGRPCDVLKVGNDSFLLTDDYAGVVYYVYKK
jgi:glucose/arabinose dehydrogenase